MKPEEFQDFFLQGGLEFPIVALKLLYNLEPYGDTKLSYEELKSIQLLCLSIRAIFMYVQDYSVYDILAGYHIQQKNLMEFADSLNNLIFYAFEYDKSVWTVGD